MIKQWMQSNDIKDKSILLENRKLIETVRGAELGDPLSDHAIANGEVQSIREGTQDEGFLQRRTHCGFQDGPCGKGQDGAIAMAFIAGG